MFHPFCCNVTKWTRALYSSNCEGKIVLEREGIVGDHAKKSYNTPKRESESANQR
jgi:hypothetical protein